jgi:signal transduction histidine kinase/ActR/RegA family two-component response regulator
LETAGKPGERTGTSRSTSPGTSRRLRLATRLAGPVVLALAVALLVEALAPGWGWLSASAALLAATLWYGWALDRLERLALSASAASAQSRNWEQAGVELRQAQEEADRASAAKSQFLAAASHDLRQPVQSLFLFLEVLRARMGDHPARPLLDMVQQSLDALKLLLDGLLDVSRLDAGLVVPQFRKIAVAPLLERFQQEYAPRAAARGLRLHTVSCHAVVHSDPVQLERMLRHLLENALRYTGRGGIVLGCRRHGDCVRLMVVDTGIGIAAHQTEAIFDEFYQVGNPERDRAKGLGLGLAVVRRLGRLLGHKVGVRSRPGRGSAFWIDVPLVMRAVAPASRKVAAPPRPGPALILVIDDEPLVRSGFGAMLEGWGYEVLTAGTADEAARTLALSGSIPAAIVADYRLCDGETGLDAIRTVHARVGRAVPAVIVTGDTAPERLREAQGGGFLLLHKPVGAEELNRTLAQMIRAASDTPGEVPDAAGRGGAMLA